MPGDAPETPETPVMTLEVQEAAAEPLEEAAARLPEEAEEEACEGPAEEGAVSGDGGDGGLPSAGSASHALGNCKPCAFLHTKGCENGLDCPFCHICELGEKKKRRKDRMRKAAEAREAVAGFELPWQPLLLATTCPSPPQVMTPELAQELEWAQAERAAAALPPEALMPPVPPSWSAWEAQGGGNDTATPSWPTWEAPGAPGLALPPVLPYLQQIAFEQQAHQLAFEQQAAWAWAQEAALAAQEAAFAASAAALSPPPAAAPGLGGPQGLLHSPVGAPWTSPERVMLSPARDEGPPTPFDRLVSMVEAGGAREANPSAGSPEPLGRLPEAVTPPRPTRRAQGARGGRRGRGEKDENRPPLGNATPKGAE